MLIPSPSKVRIGNKIIETGGSIFVIAEIGINHNGSLDIAKKMIQAAAQAGCDAVKFQKRTPEVCVPRDQWLIERETPWGRMTYIDYRHKVEFDEKQYSQIDSLCRELNILWTASCWDEPAVEFMERFSPPFYKAASASLTDHNLLRCMKQTGRPLMISTGMSTLQEIEDAVEMVGSSNLLIAHSTSTYPCPVEELNLNMISTLQREFPKNLIGYSGHETGLWATFAAAAMGATFIERHITLDRAMWGSDQAASVEPGGFAKLVSEIRGLETARGDGIKRLYESELPFRRKLRREFQLPAPA